MDANTTSKNSTHFLRGVELIHKAREDYNIPSENWPYPTVYKFGIPNDHYYAEVWIDGMDWQPSYWVIEEYQFNKPQIQPLIIFQTNEERDKFDEYNFNELVDGMLYYRRDKLWVNKNDYGIYTDSVWPYINVFGYKMKHKKMKMYSFEHASQSKVKMWFNTEFIPEEYNGVKSSNYLV